MEVKRQLRASSPRRSSPSGLFSFVFFREFHREESNCCSLQRFFVVIFLPRFTRGTLIRAPLSVSRGEKNFRGLIRQHVKIIALCWWLRKTTVLFAEAA